MKFGVYLACLAPEVHSAREFIRNHGGDFCEGLWRRLIPGEPGAGVDEFGQRPARPRTCVAIRLTSEERSLGGHDLRAPRELVLACAAPTAGQIAEALKRRGVALDSNGVTVHSNCASELLFKGR